jgi:hypothetical protein
VLSLATEAAAAQEEAPAPLTPPPAAAETPPPDLGSESEPEPAADPCESIHLEGRSWIDWFQHGIHLSVCESALWFDQLFGGQLVSEEREENHGWIRAGVNWDEREGTDPLLRGRASVYLPRMEDRLRAVIGRDDREELISDHPSENDLVPAFFGDPEDDEWLVGLGYGRAHGQRDRFDAGIGARIATPIEPYVKASYRHYHLYSPGILGRLRQTVFWESKDGLGTTSRFDLERVLDPEHLLRWRTAATWAEGSEGVRWSSGVSLYQRVGEKRAVAYEVVARGETDHEVPLREYRLRFIYRQALSREGLFLDVRPSVAWRRADLEEERAWVPALTVGVEMQFGERRPD